MLELDDELLEPDEDELPLELDELLDELLELDDPVSSGCVEPPQALTSSAAAIVNESLYITHHLMHR